MKPMTPIQLLAKGRIKLIGKHPFFGTLAMNLLLVENRDIPTLATDTRQIFYNPDFIEALYKKDFDLVMAAVAHEVGHTYLMHPLRVGHRDPTLFNMAGDYVINLQLRDAGFRIDDGWLIDDKYRGMSTEQVYDALKKNQPPAGGGSGKGGGKGSKVLGGDSGCCQHPQGTGTDGELTSSDVQRIEAEIKTKVAAAAQVARQQGKLPAGIEAEIGELLRPPERWQDILREFIQNMARDDYTWQRPNRAHIARGIVLPSMHNIRMGEIVVALDSSGSCMNEFADFLGNLNSILEDCRPEKITVIHCDAAVEKVVEFETGDEVPCKMYGGGGTSFKPPFQYVDKHGLEPECLIYFTDTYGDFPDQEPDYPVLWAVTTGADRVPWGQVIEITTRR